jgi:hypothetical protein
MAALEDEARRRGRWLLVLDTVPGMSGYRLYQRAGWTQTRHHPGLRAVPRWPALRHRGVLEAVDVRCLGSRRRFAVREIHSEKQIHRFTGSIRHQLSASFFQISISFFRNL